MLPPMVFYPEVHRGQRRDRPAVIDHRENGSYLRVIGRPVNELDETIVKLVYLRVE